MSVLWILNLEVMAAAVSGLPQWTLHSIPITEAEDNIISFYEGFDTFIK